MSRDDYISKLFIKNQDKLEQAPSADLWSRLETELDKPSPTATPVLSPRAWWSYAVAASVLLVAVVVIYQWMDSNTLPNSTQLEEPIALNTAAPPVVEEEAEPYEELPRAMGEPESNTANLVMEEKEEEEARAQEQRIVEAVQKRLEADAPEKGKEVQDIVMDDIFLADEVATEEIQLVEPSQNNYAAPGGAGGQTPEINFYQNNQPVAPELNYNNSTIPQVTNTLANNAEVEEVLSRSARKKQEDAVAEELPMEDANYIGENKIATQSTALPSRKGSIMAKAKKADKIKSPMADAHPRLYPFGFLLGRWDDDHELEGNSYEIWTLKDKNTLVGRGYKLSKDKERIFEERLRIEYRNNQVFLVMSFEENNKKVDYMLTSFDQERFVFEQKGRSKYPDKVILQQNGLQGYSVTISNSSDFLTADQQRYLEHRNRVSNVRSIRTLRQAQ